MTSTASFVASIGVNTHFNYGSGLPYADVAGTCTAISYLGVHMLRDSLERQDSIALWHQVMNTTGAKFLNYLPDGSPAHVAASFGLWDEMHRQGCVTLWEAPNEPDVPYSITEGNSIETAKAFLLTKMVPWAKVNGAKLVATAYGAGWTSTNDWRGNYDKPGNLSADVDFGNVHTYPAFPAQHTSTTIQRMNGLGKLVTPTRPIITSELGWDRKDGWTETQVAKNVLQAVFSGVELQNALTCFYALYDDASGKFGLFHPDGTATEAAHALHNLTQLLRLSGSSDVAGPLYSWNHTPNDHAVMLSGGACAWLAMWNETDAPRTATVVFRSPQAVEMHWPLTGRAGARIDHAMQVSVPISDEVVLLRIS